MQEPNQRKELTDRIMSNLRHIANIVESSFAHPYEHTEIDRITGRVVRHYKPENKPENDDNIRYGLSHNLKIMYLIAKESILHPNTCSYINRDTLEVTRQNL